MYGLLQKTDVDWEYYADAEYACLASTDKKCYWPRGKMLGGSSAMNYMVYVRGNKQNYNYWSSLGNEKWDYDHVLHFMKKFEGNRNPKIANYDHGFYHNTTGPENISRTFKIPYINVFSKSSQRKM